MSTIIYSIDINPLSALSAPSCSHIVPTIPQTQKEEYIVSQFFNFNLFGFTNNEVIDDLRKALEKYEVIEAFKVTDGDNFYVSLYIPEQGNDVRVVDIHNNGDNDFEVSISDLYDLRAIIDLPCLDDCFITEVERFNAYDTVKYVCRHWDKL